MAKMMLRLLTTFKHEHRNIVCAISIDIQTVRDGFQNFVIVRVLYVVVRIEPTTSNPLLFVVKLGTTILGKRKNRFAGEMAERPTTPSSCSCIPSTIVRRKLVTVHR